MPGFSVTRHGTKQLLCERKSVATVAVTARAWSGKQVSPVHGRTLTAKSATSGIKEARLSCELVYHRQNAEGSSVRQFVADEIVLAIFRYSRLDLQDRNWRFAAAAHTCAAPVVPLAPPVAARQPETGHLWILPRNRHGV